MCACEATFVCSRCRDTRHDPTYFDDPLEDDRDNQERAEHERTERWLREQGVGVYMLGRVW